MLLEVPQLRNTETPYRSALLQQLSTISRELERLATEMYVRGLSTLFCLSWNTSPTSTLD